MESSLEVRRSVEADGGISQKIERLRISGMEGKAPPPGLDYDIELDHGSLRELRELVASAEPIGCVFRHFLPSRLLARFDEVVEEAFLIASVICDQGLRFGARPARYARERDVVIPESVIDLLGKRLEPASQRMLEFLLQPPLFTEPSSRSITLREYSERIRNIPSQRRMELRKELLAIAPEIQNAALAGRSSTYGVSILQLPDDIALGVEYLDRFFSSSVKYLGPLRDEPKPLYPLATAVDPTDTGLRGEYTAAVLELHKSRQITYIRASNFSSSAVREKPSASSLQEAVSDWLHYLGVAQGVETRDRGKLGHELKVRSFGTTVPHDLTHVGVGASQVLPILVMCLLADVDTTVIIEQPELHLHPLVQTRLADFFLSMALLGKQCIIETHSEYLINRLRFRAASAKKDTLSSIMKVYFVENKDGGSSFREVVINQYGAIRNWPEGFFDQSQRELEEILIAATTKREQERGGG